MPLHCQCECLCGIDGECFHETVVGNRLDRDAVRQATHTLPVQGVDDDGRLVLQAREHTPLDQSDRV